MAATLPFHAGPATPRSPNPDDWGQYVDQEDQESSDDGYASTVSLQRRSQENLSRDASVQSLDSLCELAVAKSAHCLSTLHQLVVEDIADDDAVRVVVKGPGRGLEEQRWTQEGSAGCAVPSQTAYAPACAPSVWSREFAGGTVVGCSLGGIRIRKDWTLYASYRLLVSTQGRCTERWLRHSDFRAVHAALPATPAFDRVRALWAESERSRKRWRSLEMGYLVQRRCFYEGYIAELVFAVNRPDELFVLLGSGRSPAARVAPRAAREKLAR